MKASERKTVPLPPTANDDSDGDVSEEDLELLDNYGQAVTFLTSLDAKAISRCVSQFCILLLLTSSQEQVGDSEIT